MTEHFKRNEKQITYRHDGKTKREHCAIVHKIKQTIFRPPIKRKMGVGRSPYVQRQQQMDSQPDSMTGCGTESDANSRKNKYIGRDESRKFTETDETKRRTFPGEQRDPCPAVYLLCLLCRISPSESAAKAGLRCKEKKTFSQRRQK